MNKYPLRVAWSDEDGVFVATCRDFPGLAVCDETRSAAVREAEEVLEAFLEDLADSGTPPPEPTTKDRFSGQTRVRMPTGLHAALAAEAGEQGVSLNTLMVSLLSRCDRPARLEPGLEARLEQIERAVAALGSRNAGRGGAEGSRRGVAGQ